MDFFMIKGISVYVGTVGYYYESKLNAFFQLTNSNLYQWFLSGRHIISNAFIDVFFRIRNFGHMSNILPPALVRRLGNSAGFDTAAFEAVHEQEGGFTAIRINPAKWRASGAVFTDPVPWCDTGYYLTERPIFTLDPLFHAGCYYVQEAS